MLGRSSRLSPPRSSRARSRGSPSRARPDARVADDRHRARSARSSVRGIVLAVVGKDPAAVGIAGFVVSIALVVVYRRFVQKRAALGAGGVPFPEQGVGVEEYRERLQRAGIDPEAIGSQMAMALQQQQPPGRRAGGRGGRRPRGRGRPDREPRSLPAAARGAARLGRPERRRVHGVAHPFARIAPQPVGGHRHGHRLHRLPRSSPA